MIDTIGKAVRHQMLLRVTCRGCGNRGFFKAADLMMLYGGGRAPHSLRFKCRRCCRRNFDVTAVETDPDRDRKRIVWVPRQIG